MEIHALRGEVALAWGWIFGANQERHDVSVPGGSSYTLELLHYTYG
ncbi:hypothetical protein GR197_04155 [Rhizobium phaseoli]|jgi:hypothetical protein|uniref:Uncharacterized protein n=1 Tax=Rhizobium phaseoli TaxID=396 RepID=A0A7K3U8N1_9HYPH|nr:hypothetical protein [Rhizobium phaseoli]